MKEEEEEEEKVEEEEEEEVLGKGNSTDTGATAGKQL